MAGFANGQTQALVDELAKSGILDRREITQMEFAERIEGEQVTPQDVLAKVNTGKLRQDQYDQLEVMAEDFNAELPAYEPAFSSRFGDWWDKATDSFNEKGDVFGPGTGSGQELGEDIGGALGEQWSSAQAHRQIKQDFVRTAKEGGYDLDYADLMGAGSPAEMAEHAVRKTGMTPDTAASIGERVVEMQAERALAEKDTEERIEENEEVDRTNESNPTYAKNLAAFQILDRANPTKYKFDQATGAIYLTETGMQVDRRGQDIGSTDLTGEVGAALVGGWPDGGVAPFFEPDPEGTGWGQMALNSGLPIGSVTEGDYMDVLDVINNKEWYGADPSRYVSGQAFLGGFDDSYRVKVEETDVMRQTRAQMNTMLRRGISGGTNMLGGAVWDAMQESVRGTRRPWYEENDNWAQFAGLSPENIAAVQSRMIAVGALDPDEVVSGVWGPTEALQMQKWMTIANGQAVQWTELDEETLTEYFEDEAASTRPRAAFVPDPYRPMDPATVELTVRDSVRALIGRDPTEEDLQQLGGYLTDQYSSSYQADVAAGRAQYDAQVQADEAEASFAQPGAVQDVDFESRYVLEMEERFAPQIESQERAALGSRQQDMGQSMSNLMNQLGGGLG